MNNPSSNIVLLEELLQKRIAPPRERARLGDSAQPLFGTLVIMSCLSLPLLLPEDLLQVFNTYFFVFFVSAIALGAFISARFVRLAVRLRLSIWGTRWQEEYERYRNALSAAFGSASTELYAEKPDVLYSLHHKLLEDLDDKERERLLRFRGEYKRQLLARRETLIKQLEQLAAENKDLLYHFSKQETASRTASHRGGLGSGIHQPALTEIRFSLKES